jgi:uncharacterized protein
MADYYFDSSALAKRYVSEPGSLWVRRIAARRSAHNVYPVRITGAEVIAALALRSRVGTLSPAQATAAITRFKADFRRGYAIIDVSESIVSTAMDLAERHPLRGYDAVQLASAMALRSNLLPARRSALRFVSADVRLNAAAAAEDLLVEDPTNQV